MYKKNHSNIFYWVAGTVHVEWDTGLRFPYSIGCGGLYNVVVCDEPRIPDDGFAAVGCLVKRGKCSTFMIRYFIIVYFNQNIQKKYEIDFKKCFNAIIFQVHTGNGMIKMAEWDQLGRFTE